MMKQCSLATVQIVGGGAAQIETYERFHPLSGCQVERAEVSKFGDTGMVDGGSMRACVLKSQSLNAPDRVGKIYYYA
jgi:hypothetical protein